MKASDISILITNYNHAQFLPECLDAVFSQSVLPKEVIVVDDASTDESHVILQKYQEKHPELLIVLKNETNQGPAKAMNRAIQAATGTYIVLAAADDQVLPGIFEGGATYFSDYPEAGICCSNPTMFANQKPYQFRQTLISKEKKALFFPPQKIPELYLQTPLWIPTHASIYRREWVIKYGCLQEGLKHLCDWYLNCKIAINHGIIFTPQSYGAFRVSEQSYGATWNRSYRKKIELYRTLFLMLSKESGPYKKAFQYSGVLGLISSDVLLYLLLRPHLWKYIPSAFYRKSLNFFRKYLSDRKG